MTGYLIEIERTITSQYVILANDEQKAQTMASAISICADDVGLEPFQEICHPYKGNHITTHSHTLGTEEDCDNVEEAVLRFIVDLDEEDDECDDESIDDDDEDDYEPEEYFSD